MQDLGWLRWARPWVVGSMLIAHVVLPKFPVAAPENEPLGNVPLPEAKTMADLYQLRDRLSQDLDQHPTVMVTTRSGIGTAPEATLNQLWAINHRLRQEDRARWLQRRAEAAAAAAMNLGNPATLAPEPLARAYGHWERALTTLDQMPAGTLTATLGTAQRQRYERQRAIAAYYYDTARSDFLRPMVDATGMASRVRLTVCTLQRECRRWQGDRPPASPASLIKVPMAIALMTHLHQAGVDPTEAIWLDRSNWTEDAGSLWVNADYPLQEIMADMVSASGNIATNQLIDYLGWHRINQTLLSQGYQATQIRTKLVGESTYPANPGQGPNQLTTDELTDMMVSLYNREIPHADLIQAALANQRDRNLGHAAVRPPITWLGEKTGRNSKVLGSTTAVSIGDQRYIITATLDHSANEATLRSLLARVMQYLLIHNGFEQQGNVTKELVKPDHERTPPRSLVFLPPP